MEGERGEQVEGREVEGWEEGGRGTVGGEGGEQVEGNR